MQKNNINANNKKPINVQKLCLALGIVWGILSIAGLTVLLIYFSIWFAGASFGVTIGLCFAVIGFILVTGVICAPLLLIGFKKVKLDPQKLKI